MLVPEKSREGTSTAPRAAGIAANTASISSAAMSGMSDNTVQTVCAPWAISAAVARATRDVEAARKFLVESERAGRARHREQARVGGHDGDVVGGGGAERGGEHVAKHGLGQSASLAGRQDRREPGLGEFELLGGNQDKAHGVSL